MPSPHELSGGEFSSPYSADVRARNIRIGDHYHAERAKEFTKRLEELAATYPKLINQEQIALAAELEGQDAGEAAIVQREAGLMNDEKSKKPGIFVSGHMDYEAFAAMEEQFRIYRVPYTLAIVDHSRSFAPYTLHLPMGAFKCQIEEGLLDQYHLSIFGSVEFEADSEDFKPIGSGAHFLTGGYIGHHSVHGVVDSIEGADGMIWLNPKTRQTKMPNTDQSEAA